MTFYMDSNMRVFEHPANRLRALNDHHMLDARYDEYSTDRGNTWDKIPEDWNGNAYFQLLRRWFRRPPEKVMLRSSEPGKLDRDEIHIRVF